MNTVSTSTKKTTHFCDALDTMKGPSFLSVIHQFVDVTRSKEGKKTVQIGTQPLSSGQHLRQPPSATTHPLDNAIAIHASVRLGTFSPKNDAQPREPREILPRHGGKHQSKRIESVGSTITRGFTARKHVPPPPLAHPVLCNPLVARGIWRRATTLCCFMVQALVRRSLSPKPRSRGSSLTCPVPRPEGPSR